MIYRASRAAVVMYTVGNVVVMLAAVVIVVVGVSVFGAFAVIVMLFVVVFLLCLSRHTHAITMGAAPKF